MQKSLAIALVTSSLFVISEVMPFIPYKYNGIAHALYLFLYGVDKVLEAKDAEEREEAEELDQRIASTLNETSRVVPT